ncbi:MAG: MarP family serine protease [Terrimesophilobacter sp.]
MPGVWLFDGALVLLLLSYLIYGYRVGLIVSLGGILGVVAGAIAAFFAIPLVSNWVVESGLRIAAILLSVLALVILGQALGTALGRMIRRSFKRSPLRVIDRVLGGVVSLVVSSVLLSMLAFSVGSLGVPLLSQAIASSRVLGTIDTLTPDPVAAAEAELRALVAQGGVRIIDALAPDEALTAPDTLAPTAQQQAAARSVVKITGTAYQCGQNQSGSGFAVAADRVVTNAHVVAGVGSPVVEVPGGGALPGKVVFFDPVHDLAVIQVPGLSTPTLSLAKDLSSGDSAVFDGYPLGGPFRSNPATVKAVATVNVPDIYGQNPSPLEVYSLAANVQEGNSGGPLLDADGRVAGVVFAKAASGTGQGFALTNAELAPVVAKAAGLTQPVAAGHCTRG